MELCLGAVAALQPSGGVGVRAGACQAVPHAGPGHTCGLLPVRAASCSQVALEVWMLACDGLSACVRPDEAAPAGGHHSPRCRQTPALGASRSLGRDGSHSSVTNCPKEMDPNLAGFAGDRRSCSVGRNKNLLYSLSL